jgi:hypothetical protein
MRTLDLQIARKILWWSAVLLPAGAVAASFFFPTWPAKRFLVFYVAPLFLAAPIWVRLRISERPRTGGLPSILDAGVFLLSFLRFVAGEVLPFSGHMLFLTYSGLTTRRTAYRLLALGLLVETTVFKLWLWRDPRSWALGLAIGLVAAAFYQWPASRPAI